MNDDLTVLHSYLTQLGVRVHKVTDNRVAIYCPFHKGGQERKASAAVYNSGRVVCFTCGYRESFTKFLTDLGASQETVSEARDLVKRLKKPEAQARPQDRHVDIAAWVGVFRSNYPKNLLDAGFTPETLDLFSVGYDSRFRRVTYPVRDRFGQLVAVVGGAIDDQTFPKYKLYDEEINIPRKEKQEHRDHLWGLHLFPGDSPLVVVEGYKAAMAVAQAGFAVCATQGTSYTRKQVDILVNMYRPILLMLDQDDAGRAAQQKLHMQLLNYLGSRAKRVPYPKEEAMQPDWLTPKEIAQAIEEAC